MFSDFFVGFSSDSWQVTEWLINYQGGFVRRGIFGEVIFQLSSFSQISPYYWAFAISLGSFAYLCSEFMNYFKKEGWPISLVFSPIFLGMPVFSDFWFRKDLFLLILLILMIRLSLSEGKLKLLLVNVIAVIAILCHEGFFFFGLLPTCIYIWLKQRQDIDGLYIRLLKILAFLSPSFFAFLFVINSHGDYLTSLQIQDSWSDFYFPFEAKYIGMDNAITAIGWSKSQGLQHSLSIFDLKNSSSLIILLVWVSTIFIYLLIYLNFIFSDFNRTLDNSLRVSRTFLIFKVNAILIFPLFFLGFDYGRWIFLLGASTLIFLMNTPAVVLRIIILNLSKIRFFASVGPMERLLNKISICALNGKLNTKRLSFIHLLVSVPVCCWSIHHYVLCLPLFQPIRFLKRLQDTLDISIMF